MYFHKRIQIRRRINLLLDVVRRFVSLPKELVDAVWEMSEREILLECDSKFAVSLRDAVMAPLCRDAQELLFKGMCDEKSLLQSVDSCPRVLLSSFEKLQRVAKSVRLLDQMNEAQRNAVVEQQISWSHVMRQCEALYQSECGRLVHLLLYKRGGLNVLEQMRESFGAAPLSVDWPLSELFWTDTNKQGYQAVGKFVETLQSAKKGCCFFFLKKKLFFHFLKNVVFLFLLLLLFFFSPSSSALSRLRDIHVASAIRFRQKALHFVSCIFCSIVSLRLNHDFSWTALSTLLKQNTSDFEQLQKAHDGFVRDMVDVCLLNDASRPLLKAVQQVLACCEEFAASEGLADVVVVVEPALDANVQTFVKLVQGMLRQRKIAHLQGMLIMMRFNEHGEE